MKWQETMAMIPTSIEKESHIPVFMIQSAVNINQYHHVVIETMLVKVYRVRNHDFLQR